MRLIYCDSGGISRAAIYGKEKWEGEILINEPYVCNSHTGYNGVPADSIEIKEFCGIIQNIDEEDEPIFIEVENNDGARREFGVDGGFAGFKVGQNALIRYREILRPDGRVSFIDLLEVWVAD